MKLQSKLPSTGTTIFSVMSALANQHGAINLSQGFPDFDCDEQLKAYVHEGMKKGLNQYAPMAGLPALREAIAQKIHRTYGTDIHPDQEITVCAGATQAIFTAVSAFVHPGDEVIIIEPAYDCYQPAIEVNGGKAIAYPITGPDFKVDWTAFGQLITDKTRMIMINSPHNPTSTKFSDADMQALQYLVRDTDILILSDEVYEHLVYDGAQHQSILRYPELYERSIATYSFGKTFHTTGWKMGYAVGPADLMAEFRKVHQFNVFSVNTPMQYGIAQYLQDPATYESLPGFFQRKRDLFMEGLSASRFDILKPEGTYFMLVDYRAISDESDVDFARRMTIEHGVASIPLSPFYGTPPGNKVVRFCFAKTEHLLESACEKLMKI
ncbi:MAG: methionine aminotransferase [Bacteroidota bacterium]